MKTLKTRLKEKIDNFYLMQGEDIYLYDRAFSMIKNSCNINFPDFNIIKFDDDNFSMQAVVDTCQVLPMGDELKIVYIKNISKITENDKKMLENYLNNPVLSTILVIFDYYEKFSQFKEKSSFVDCKRFDRNMAMSFVVKEFEKRGKQISLDGCNELVDLCNGYLTRIVCEIDKLAYYDMNEIRITKKLVDEMVTKDSEYAVYELTEALGTRNADKAIKMLDQMSKEPGMIGLITNHFRRLFFISTSMLDDKALASLLGVKEYAVMKQRAQIKNFSKMQLKKIYSLLEEIDYNVKSGAFLQENALYYLVLSILYI